MKQVGKMNQKLMIENLKELSSELWKHAAESKSIMPAAWAESLDETIKTLERIRWRKVEEEVPNYDIEGMEILQTKFSIRHPELRFISLNYYCPETENKWNNPKTVGTSHWAYPPELPEEEDENNGTHQ
nr:MAG TPA: hypothetical protein [Caudoviricetes sp.]